MGKNRPFAAFAAALLSACSGTDEPAAVSAADLGALEYRIAVTEAALMALHDADQDAWDRIDALEYRVATLESALANLSVPSPWWTSLEVDAATTCPILRAWSPPGQPDLLTTVETSLILVVAPDVQAFGQRTAMDGVTALRLFDTLADAEEGHCAGDFATFDGWAIRQDDAVFVDPAVAWWTWPPQ